jgi:hypothetical protein
MPRIRLVRFVVVFLCWFSIAVALALLIDRTFAMSPDSRWTARLHGAVIGGRLRFVRPRYERFGPTRSTEMARQRVNPRQPSNQSVELTATRCALPLSMAKPLPLRATLALGGGSSLLSR